MSSYAIEAWIRTGQAAEAAKDIVWFVILVFVAVAFIAWRDSK